MSIIQIEHPAITRAMTTGDNSVMGWDYEEKTIKCKRCGAEHDLDEAEFHESGECLHIPATENYAHELGEGYIFGDKKCTERFCMESILGSGYLNRIESSLRRTITDMVKMRINILRALESSVAEIPRETDRKLWAALGFMDNLNTYEEYKTLVREFCLDEDIDGYSEWYCTAHRTELYGGIYEWVDTNEVATVKAAV